MALQSAMPVLLTSGVRVDAGTAITLGLMWFAATDRIFDRPLPVFVARACSAIVQRPYRVVRSKDMDEDSSANKF
jgi:hypothetical protein